MAEETPKVEVNIIIISDSAGDTAFNNAVAGAAQFPDAQINYRRYPFIFNLEKLDETLAEISNYPNLVIIYSLAKDRMQIPVIRFAREHHVQSVDILSPVTEAIQNTTGMKPLQK
ncbi:transcriptional regulator, partial [Lactobacillus sp. XV13L]|nr:transcriptional regulator [Lactobacillus sp. XV13L]